MDSPVGDLAGNNLCGDLGNWGGCLRSVQQPRLRAAFLFPTAVRLGRVFGSGRTFGNAGGKTPMAPRTLVAGCDLVRTPRAAQSWLAPPGKIGSIGRPGR